MEELLNALDELYSKTDSETYEYKFEADCWTRTFFVETDEVYKVACLCDKYLISQGDCDWNNIRKLEEYGYNVFAIEEDSCGWLIAGLRKDGDPRVLIYG